MRELEDPEYREIWDAFNKKFRFCPGVGGPYPGIDEPKPSITFKLPEDYPLEDLSEIALTLRNALKVCTQPDEEIYYLDWQHQCFAFKPHEDDPDTWFNGFPDGDYAIFLSKDLSFGSFGHPWERTICCFGENFNRGRAVGQPAVLPRFRSRFPGGRSDSTHPPCPCEHSEAIPGWAGAL